jgi:hypothetical protein
LSAGGSADEPGTGGEAEQAAAFAEVRGRGHYWQKVGKYCAQGQRLDAGMSSLSRCVSHVSGEMAFVWYW